MSFARSALRAPRHGFKFKPPLNPLQQLGSRHTLVRDTISDLLKYSSTDTMPHVDVYGFVRSVRSQKHHHFVSLGDGTTMDSLQAVVPADQAEGLTTGVAVRLQGAWTHSPGRKQSHELKVEKVEVLGPSDAKTFPIQKKYHTLEYLRTMPHLRPRVPINAAILRLRSEVIHHLDCEGAGEVFHISSSADEPSPDSETASQFFRRPVYTTVSAQLHLEAMSQALGNVWTLSPTFRAEQSDTPRHLSEFYMLEAEMSFLDDLNPMLDFVEEMLGYLSHSMGNSSVVNELLDPERSSDLAPATLVRERWEALKRTKWPRITYTEAIKLLETADVSFTHKPLWGKDLQTEHEKYITTAVGEGIRPVFVTNYPQDIKAFYMKSNVDTSDGSESGATVGCFDLLVPDFCEIAGGSLREHRLDPLVESMRARGMTSSPSTGGSAAKSEMTGSSSNNNLDWYLDLRRWGCPPHGGFGLGFDRLICYLSGVQTIRDSTAFPRWHGRCDC